MIDGVFASIAGTRAFGKKLGNAAGNIANCNTDGYKRTEAVITEDQAGLPEVTLSAVDRPGVIYADTDGTRRETSNVDLSEEMTQMLIARRAYEANIVALKAQDETVKSVLDIFA